MPLVGTGVARSFAALALPVYLSEIDGRAVTPGFAVSAHTSVDTMSAARSITAASRRARVAAIVSPDRCWLDKAVFSADGTALTIWPELSAPPRRGLWQPSHVRRSPGRTWIQLVCVWKARPLASMTASAIGVSAGTFSLKDPSGSIGA